MMLPPRPVCVRGRKWWWLVAVVVVVVAVAAVETHGARPHVRQHNRNARSKTVRVTVTAPSNPPSRGLCLYRATSER